MADRLGEMSTRKLVTIVGVVIGLMFLTGAGLLYQAQISDVKNERRGCKRLDDVRSAVYRVFTLAAVAQEKDKTLAKNQKQKEEQLLSAKLFEAEARKLVRSIERYGGVEPILVHPDDPLPAQIHVNCEIAYPFPGPFGGVFDNVFG